MEVEIAADAEAQPILGDVSHDHGAGRLAQTQDLDRAVEGGDPAPFGIVLGDLTAFAVGDDRERRGACCRCSGSTAAGSRVSDKRIGETHAGDRRHHGAG